MIFAQALARIEELAMFCLGPTTLEQFTASKDEIRKLLYSHADSIVQLGKVAEQMRSATSSNAILDADEAYDKLMNSGES